MGESCDLNTCESFNKLLCLDFYKNPDCTIYIINIKTIFVLLVLLGYYFSNHTHNRENIVPFTLLCALTLDFLLCISIKPSSEIYEKNKSQQNK